MRNDAKSELRGTRRQFNFAKTDYRESFERDRDRILFSSALHRLAGISQIVSSSDLSFFHTRYQHTIKVAQVGRRLAEFCKKNEGQTGLHADKIRLNVDVVEAACLAHDLGHPPFGHVGENVLNTLAESTVLDEDGLMCIQTHGDEKPSTANENCFEGNAQSFRILTKLAVRFPGNGMNLTEATLAACLKYPWIRDIENQQKIMKWGAYSSEKDALEFARENSPGETRSVEADMMDWADDIAYSVHDMEEFHRCNFFDWQRIFSASSEKPIIEGAQKRWFGHPSNAAIRLGQAFERIRDLSHLYPGVFGERYTGSRDQRYELRNLNSLLVSRYIECVSLEEDSQGSISLHIPDNYFDEVLILKEFTKQFVLTNASILSQQSGQRKIIADLYTAIMSDINHNQAELNKLNKSLSEDEQQLELDLTSAKSIVPERLRYLWELRDGNPIRFALDCIASLTEREAIEWHSRLSGKSSNSVLDPILQ